MSKYRKKSQIFFPVSIDSEEIRYLHNFLSNECKFDYFRFDIEYLDKKIKTTKSINEIIEDENASHNKIKNLIIIATNKSDIENDEDIQNIKKTIETRNNSQHEKIKSFIENKNLPLNVRMLLGIDVGLFIACQLLVDFFSKHLIKGKFDSFKYMLTNNHIWLSISDKKSPVSYRICTNSKEIYEKVSKDLDNRINKSWKSYYFFIYSNIFKEVKRILYALPILAVFCVLLARIVDKIYPFLKINRLHELVYQFTELELFIIGLISILFIHCFCELNEYIRKLLFPKCVFYIGKQSKKPLTITIIFKWLLGTTYTIFVGLFITFLWANLTN